MVIEACAQFIILEFHGQWYGILNIYANNKSTLRIHLWTHLQCSFLATNWIILGDYNTVE